MLPVYMFNFNSIKVRLKHSTASTHLDYSSFQFHKGTIKTPPLFVLGKSEIISIP